MQGEKQILWKRGVNKRKKKKQFLSMNHMNQTQAKIDQIIIVKALSQLCWNQSYNRLNEQEVQCYLSRGNVQAQVPEYLHIWTSWIFEIDMLEYHPSHGVMSYPHLYSNQSWISCPESQKWMQLNPYLWRNLDPSQSAKLQQQPLSRQRKHAFQKPPCKIIVMAKKTIS